MRHTLADYRVNFKRSRPNREGGDGLTCSKLIMHVCAIRCSIARCATRLQLHHIRLFYSFCFKRPHTHTALTKEDRERERDRNGQKKNNKIRRLVNMS